MPLTSEQILGALRRVEDPDLRRDLVSLGMIESLEVRDGEVSFTLVLTTAACPLREQLERDVRAAVATVPGVKSLRFETISRMRKPRDPTADRLRKTPATRDGKVLPIEAHGLRFMSMGLLVDQGEAVVWRGPMLHSAVKTFLHDVDWGELDYLLVDLPPGTGDVQLSLIQQTFVAGAVVVTTPSTVAIEDAVKAIDMFAKLQVPVLGVVENMSGFVCPACGARHEIFNSGHPEERALAMGLPFLGAIPLHPAVRAAGDEGRPAVLDTAGSEYAAAFSKIAGELARRVSIQAVGAGSD